MMTLRKIKEMVTKERNQMRMMDLRRVKENRRKSGTIQTKADDVNCLHCLVFLVMDERVLAGSFRILKELGSGNFGTVFRCVDIHTGEVVAVKVEKRRPGFDTDTETIVYKVLSNSVGFPKFLVRKFELQYNVLVIEELSESLQTLLDANGGHFSLKTTLMIIDQVLLRVEYLHRKHFLHRDLKPENFLLGKQNHRNVIHLIDFGLSKLYRNPETISHNPSRENLEPIGNARFSSINNHMKKDQSRADDLESLGYIFVYLLTGALPWMGMKAESMKEKWHAIWCVKMTNSIDRICEGTPQEFSRFLKSVRALKFDETPNYSEYRQMFRELFVREGFVYDYQFDWPAAEPEEPQAPAPVRERRASHVCDSSPKPRPRLAVPVCRSRQRVSNPRRQSAFVETPPVLRFGSAGNVPRCYRAPHNTRG